MTSPPRHFSTLLPLVLVFVLGACGGDGAASPDVTLGADEFVTTTALPAPTTITDPDAAIKADVEQAFYEQWDAFVQILGELDPASPLIDRYFTGEAKDSLIKTMGDFVLSKEALRLPESGDDFAPRIISIHVDGPNTATVFECTIDGLVVVDVSTDTVVNDSVSTYAARNTFLLEGNAWRLESSRSLEPDDPSCDDL